MLYPFAVMFNVSIIYREIMINPGIFIFHTFPDVQSFQSKFLVQSLLSYKIEILYEQ